ncbi:MAG: PT domain-containing protein [Phycisphaerae bacterium]|nr:PT domain-containing protein [Phycisphaerae bacterium]
MAINKHTFWGIVTAFLLVAGSASQAADKGIHIPSGRNVSGSWNTADGAGYQWNIYVAGGYVNSGSHSAYSSGMQLQINGSGFSGSSSGRLSKDGTEIEIGPWKYQSVNVYRRIYVDKKIGYCRWIDIFENPTTTAKSLTLRYYNGMGTSTRKTYTTTGGTTTGAKDWGIVTGYTSSSYSAVAHVFATKKSKVRPRFQWTRSNSTVYYHHTLQIPPKKTVAICLIEAQRRPFATAQQFLTNFKVEKELKKIPRSLRKIIINMTGTMLTLGTLELPRNESHDLIVQRGGNELLGTLLNENYVVETLYGKLTLDAARVVGLHSPANAGDRIRLALADGQVIVGKLLSGQIRLKLANGNEMSMPPEKIDTAAYKVSPQRPEEIAFRKPMVVLRGGQQLFFKDSDVDWTFHTQYGRVKLNPADLREIVLDTPDGGLHRAIFANESVLSGLLVTDKLSVSLNLGPKLSIPRYLIQQFAFPTADYNGPDLAELTLKNEDILHGRVSDELLKIATDLEEVSVKRDEIAQITIPEEATLGRIRVKLHSGTVVEGKLVGKSVGFQVAPGASLPVYVGHVVEMNCPKPAPKPTTQPAKKPTDKPTDKPPVRPSAEPTAEPAPPAPAPVAPEPAVPILRAKLVTRENKRIGQLRDLAKKLTAELASTTGKEKAAKLKKQLAIIQKQIAIEQMRSDLKTRTARTLKETAKLDKAKAAKLNHAIEVRLQPRS